MGNVVAYMSMSLDGFVAVRLFDNVDVRAMRLEFARVVEGSGVTHLRFRLMK